MTKDHGNKEKSNKEKDESNSIDLDGARFNEKDIFRIQEFKNIMTESLNPINAFTEAFDSMEPSIFRVSTVQSEVLDNLNLIADRLPNFSSKELIARDMVGNTALRLSETIDSLMNLEEMTSAVSEALKVIPENNITALQATVDNFKSAASFSVADRLLGTMSDINFKFSGITDIPAGVEYETPYEIPKEKAHDMIVKDAEISKEEAGKDVPYNVLSDYFIYTYYIPTMGIIYNASTSDTIDVNLVLSTLIFTIVPMIYSLSQDTDRSDDNKKSKEVNFDNDITFID